MKFLSIAFLFVSSIAALPTDRLQERQSGIVITTGATGNVLPRYEVRQLKDKFYNQWVLFILAVAQMHNAPQSSPTSYYGIANIHGVPRDNYNGVQQCNDKSCKDMDGYGTHNSVLFPPWHRVYIALFEQEMIKVAKTIANSYPASQRQTMVNAANQLRMPYWDWAAHPGNGRPVLPLMISDVDVTVPGPTGQKTFTNPLFRHDFQDPSGMVYTSPPFTQWKRTYRWPNNLSSNPASQTQKCADAYSNSRQSLQDQMYSLFTRCTDYLHFSNDMAGSSSTACSTSLENIHNTVHSIAGGPDNTNAGHMTFIPISSYDPIFWLHHTNVDRYFAMWQRLHSGYVQNQVAPTASWTIAQGSTQGIDSPLTPFYKDNSGNFWTARQVQDWTTLKYTYPEFANSDGTSASISRYINNLYGPGATANAGSSKREASPQSGLLGKVLSIGNPLVAKNGSLYEYTANIKTPRYFFGTSYSVFVFNGPPTSEDPQSWYFDQKLIGPMGVAAGATSEDESLHPKDLIISGSIPLTRTLQNLVGNAGILSGLAEALVVPFLAKNLEWRVLGPNGQSVDPATIPGFSVTVAASTASQSGSDDVLPTFSDFVELLDVTKGRAGGANTTLAAMSF